MFVAIGVVLLERDAELVAATIHYVEVVVPVWSEVGALLAEVRVKVVCTRYSADTNGK